MRATRRAGAERLTPRRGFALAFVAYFLLAAAWALALPVNGTYDEKQHIVWAYAVLDGQWTSHERTVDATGNPTDGFRGPRSLLPANADCTWFPRSSPKPASCLRVDGSRATTVQPSAAARYNPIYYALVGLPIRISPDEAGVVGARLLSAALSALLLAAATAIAIRLRNRLLVAAVVLVCTPLAMNLIGSINPNGLEISAGVLLFGALLAVVRPAADLSAGDRPRLLLAAGLAGVFLLTVRNLGPLLFALAVLACALAAPPGRVRELLRDRSTWRWFGGPVVAGLILFAAWTVASRHSAVQPLDDNALDLGPLAIVQDVVVPRTEFYARQIVGQFGYGETTVSLGMIGLWYLLVAALVLPALWFGDRRLRLSMLAVAVACVMIIVALELYFVPLVGPFAHGRYIMPLGAGVVLFAAFADRYAQWLTERGWLVRLTTALVVVTVPLDLYALARVMTRFQRGIGAGLNPFGGTWLPVAGPIAPVLCCLVGGLLLAVIVALSSVRRAPEHSTVNTLSN